MSPLTDDEKKLVAETAEETAIRTAEEITGRHRLTPEQRAVLEASTGADKSDTGRTTARWTVIAGICALSTAIAIAVGALWWVAGTAAQAAEAKTATVDHEPRIRTLEQGKAATDAKLDAINKSMDEVKRDLRDIKEAVHASKGGSK